tara:strand:- start:2840 stop:3424 length:585 start_codon:yes stop_codon:yes gene_type:complete
VNILNQNITEDDIRAYAQNFQDKRSTYISAPFEASFLTKLEELISKQEYVFFDDPRIGKEERIDNDKFYAKLNLILSSAGFLNFIREITKVESIKMATTRVYRINEKEDHQVYWHNDDRVLSRVLSMRIELSHSPYEGGEFQLRETASKKILATSGQLSFGDAFLFEVDFKQLEHQVLQVTKGVRTSLIIWFLK